MKLIKNIIIVVGGPGSGKTEYCLNLAFNQINEGRKIKIIDLDLVNPYFRIREVRNFLYKYNIEIVLPSNDLLNADLPILSPSVLGSILNNSGLLIMDIGGGSIGSRVLASLADIINKDQIEVLCVINPYRPYNKTISKCLRLFLEIELSSNLKISGIIINSNFMYEFNINNFYKDYNFLSKISYITKVPILSTTIPSKKLFNSNIEKNAYSILPIWKRLFMPWHYFGRNG